MRHVLSARTTLGFSPCHVSYFGTRRNAFRTFNSKNTAFDTKGDLQGQDILLKYAEQHKNACYILAFHREKKGFLQPLAVPRSLYFSFDLVTTGITASDFRKLRMLHHPP